MSEHEHQHGSKFFIGLLLGGIAAAGAFYLFGTKDGKKTRKIMEEKSKEVLDDLHDKLEEIEEQGRTLKDRGEKLKEHIERQIEEKKDYLTHEASERLDQTLKRVEELQEKGREETSNLRKRLFRNLPKKK
jgi:gas vesicle protein